MALTSTQAARLAELDEIIAASVSSTSKDGVSITYDLAAARKERDSLRQLALSQPSGSRFRRVTLNGG
jgi:hypothetical protein